MRDLIPFVAGALLVLAGCGDDPSTADGSTTSGQGGGGGSPPAGPVSGQVTRYGYTFDLESLAGHSRVDLDVAQGGDCAALPSIPATAATWNDAPAKQLDNTGGMLTVCGDGVAGGSQLRLGAEVVVPETTEPGLDVGFSRKPSGAGGTFSYLLSWVEGCDHFGPCDDAPASLARFSFEVAHPSGTTVVCPGTLLPGETSTRCELDGTLAPTYSAFSLAANSDWVRTELFDVPNGAGGQVSIVAYETPAGKIGAKLDGDELAKFFAWLTKLLGPYPYGDELRLATGPTEFLGFEHPGNILLDYKLAGYNGPWADPLAHVVMHEVVHQWAGNRTTLASTLDFVWKEATCEYLVYAFLAEQGATAAAQKDLDFWHAASLGAQYYPRPTDDPPPALPDFYGDAYGPGPLVLYVQLESMFGRDKILAAIAGFLAEPGWRSVDELRLELEKTTGQDLVEYFEAWVFGSGVPAVPVIVADVEQVDDQVTVTLTQQGVAKPRGCAVEVDLAGANGAVTALVDFGTAPSQPSASTTVTLAGAIDTVTVNPRRRALVTTPGATAVAPTLRRYY